MAPIAAGRHTPLDGARDLPENGAMAAFRKALTRFDDYYEMMADPVRTAAYAEAIRRVVRPGDRVVDLGAGLGILGFLALEAGASRVVAIEKSDSIELARAVAERNGLADRVEFVAANSKEVELDEPADVLVSETLGSFAVDENTLDFTIDARERLLRPGGAMIPRRLDLWLCPVETPAEHARLLFWKDVQGVDYSPAIEQILRRMSLASVGAKQLLAAPARYAEIDLATVSSAELERPVEIELTRRGTIHGLAGWFDAELAEGVHISTSPKARATHWRQAFFPFLDPVRVSRGDTLQLVLRVAPKSETSDDTVISYDYYCSQKAREVEQARSARVGRNDPCPCGSGKKHKRCCGR